MDHQLLLKVLCANQGGLDVNVLADIGYGADLICDLDKLDKNDSFHIELRNGKKRIVAKTKVRRCTAQECNGCNDLHLCKFYLFGDCKNSRGRRTCRFCHNLNSEHNISVLRSSNLEKLSIVELRQLLLQNDNSLLPQVCMSYNNGTGHYGNCPHQDGCRRLHMCDRYIRGACSARAQCTRCHDFFEPHPWKSLQQRGVPSELVASMLSTYQNIQALRSVGARGATAIRQPESCLQTNTGMTEICLFFVKGDCKQGDKCWRVHHKMPYKWEVKEGLAWSPLLENEAIERDFCDPSKIHSEGSKRVDFDSMTCGFDEVRRLSTISSVLQHTYLLTTEWAWFWKDEYGQWVKYASIKEMHRLSSITSQDLEKKYQEDPGAVVKFTAGQQTYELSFKDMTQRNERYGTVRMVRRRPVFISTTGAQAIRSRTYGPRNTSKNFRSLPGFWDKSAIPDNGYKTVTLPTSERDYQKIQGLFNKTMRGFHIISIERVQNPDLWEEFQRKRDKMKKNNGDKNSKELTLFHGTDPKHIDDICRDNFDWRLCGTNGTVYGQGSYFARDAKYSHSYTSQSEQRTMFACRVIVGDYTRGNSDLRLPPSKGAGNSSLYDSCVDNTSNPSIYVVFEKNQVYPEFLIKYDDGTTQPKTVSIQYTTLTPISNFVDVGSTTTPLKTVPFTLSPSQTVASSNPTHSCPTSSTVHNPASTPSYTVSTPASTSSYSVSTPTSSPSCTVSTPTSTPSCTVSTPASTPSYAVTSNASTPSHTASTPASTPSYSASTPSYSASTPASTTSYSVSTPASTASYSVSTPASTPSYAVTPNASTPSYTASTPASTPSYTLSNLASKRLSPPRHSDILTPSARNPSHTLTPSTLSVSRTHTLSATTLSVRSSSHPLSTSSLSTLNETCASLNTSLPTSSNSSMPTRPAHNPSTVFSSPPSIFSHPLSSPTRNSRDIPYRVPTAQPNRRGIHEKNKCLLQ